MSTPTTTCRAWCTRHQSDPYDSAEPGYCHASVESFSSWDVSIVQGGRWAQGSQNVAKGNDRNNLNRKDAALIRLYAESLTTLANQLDVIAGGAA